jgi:lipopolysaccharide biosynthesis glycosyltransferase
MLHQTIRETEIYDAFGAQDQDRAPTLTQSPIAIAFAADANYTMPLAVTIQSLLANFNDERAIVVFVLDGGVTDAQKRRIAKSIPAQKVELFWVQPSQHILDKLPVSEKYPISIYYRLLLPQIVPDHIRKIIYLDADLVVKGNIAQLWDLPLDEYYALAVPNLCQRTMAMAKHLDHEKYGISPDCKYFNTGVLVINLEKWRSDHISEQAINFLEANTDNVIFPDQDALNIVLAGKWKELDPRWNQMHALHTYSSWEESPYDKDLFTQVLYNPYIVHFTTPPKPWHTGCQHPQQNLFFQYLDMTAWRGWRNTIWRRGWKKLMQLVRRGLR